MAALPQCIQSAKELYDLKSRYKDASILISAIYSESMVIAASLSQVQNLLQHDGLQSKPQLLETLDRALTGCRVVYGCLEEEVRELVAKTEADDLRFKDRAKFLWKEDTFKELLTQIRGQQSALSLLIQGLQMESIADIKKLVESNSVTLDQVVKRSKTLRQSHPRIRVPDSLFDHPPESVETADVESILRATEFSFDDEVINSRAYRRAMALYTSKHEAEEPHKSASETEKDAPPAYETPIEDLPSAEKSIMEDQIAEAESTKDPAQKSPVDQDDGTIFKDNHQDAFDSIEKDFLPYMPRITSTAPYLTASAANASDRQAKQPRTTPAQTAPTADDDEMTSLVEEEAPPLPPRRPSGHQLSSISSETSIDEPVSPDGSTDVSILPSICSSTSLASSCTTQEVASIRNVVSRKAMRKPLPANRRGTDDVLPTTRSLSSSFESPTTRSTLQNTEIHALWVSIIDADRTYIERITKFRKMFYDNVIRQWPRLEKHLEAILACEQLAGLDKDILLSVVEQQVAGSDGSICDPAVFEHWVNKAYTMYRDYCQKMPHAVSSLKITQERDTKFIPFVNTVGLSLAWFGKSWQDYIKLPLTQLDLYTDKLQEVMKIVETLNDPAAFQETRRLQRALGAIEWLKTVTMAVLEDAESKEEIQNLEKRIHTLDATIFSQLRLLDSSRRVLCQGGMAIKLKSEGSWQAVHVMLLDNFLLWGKVKTQKKVKGDRVVVLDTPLPVDDLEVTTPGEENHFEKATMFDELPRGSVLYTIAVRNKTSQKKPHTLGALGFENRKVWLQCLTAVTAGHKAST